ncbi:MAG: hypothetical protein GYA17_02635 [Chloroflexi bacterium]|nr:hypothetical protein [Anaerolineaceae bacterium]NMB87227.1 hypothetical protein [Chloroflexota bacterium]
MDEQQFERVLANLAEEQVPAGTDLWPAIRVRFETSQWRLAQSEDSMQTTTARTRRLRLVSVFLSALLLVGILVAVTPQGRAFAQSVLQFFTRAPADSLPVQDWQRTPAVNDSTAADPADINAAELPVDVVEGQAGFDVLEPAWLPPSLTFAGATLEAEHSIVRIFYRYEDTNGLVLREEPYQLSEDCELCGLVGDSAVVEEVSLGQATAEYVEGVWNLTDDGPVWVSDPYLKTMRWQADGMAFELVYMGPPDSLSKDDLAAIAQSMQ